MQLDIEKVKLSNRDIKRIYFDAFPKKERMPFLIMVPCLSYGIHSFYVFMMEIKNRYPGRKSFKKL